MGGRGGMPMGGIGGRGGGGGGAPQPGGPVVDETIRLGFDASRMAYFTGC